MPPLLLPSIPLSHFYDIDILCLKLETSHVNLTFSNNIQYSESENFIYIFWIQTDIIITRLFKKTYLLQNKIGLAGYPCV